MPPQHAPVVRLDLQRLLGVAGVPLVVNQGSRIGANVPMRQVSTFMQEREDDPVEVSVEDDSQRW